MVTMSGLGEFVMYSDNAPFHKNLSRKDGKYTKEHTDNLIETCG